MSLNTSSSDYDYCKHRWHLWEWHDLESCPQDFRSYLTGILIRGWHFQPVPAQLHWLLPKSWVTADDDGCAAAQLKGWASQRPVDIAASVIEEVLQETGHTNIVDCCSGSGGPTPTVTALIRERASRRQIRGSAAAAVPATNIGLTGATATLTDLFPHNAEWTKIGKVHPYVTFSAERVDATQIKSSPQTTGLRTIMAAWHHFTPSLAERILSNAVHSNNPFCAIEMTERKLMPILTLALISIMFALLFPLIGFVTLNRTRVFFCYIVPLFVVGYVWDSVVSCLRSYTPSELQAMARRADPQGKFEWRTGSRRVVSWYPWFNMTYLIGVPAAKKEN